MSRLDLEAIFGGARLQEATAKEKFSSLHPSLRAPRRLRLKEIAVMTKSFRIDASQIKPLVSGYGYCYATDRIVVDGARVGFMYRERPDRERDSGWRFFSGDEDQKYVDNPNNIGIYDVNTIANYDSDVIPHLDAPYGSAFSRVAGVFQPQDIPNQPN